MPTYLIHFRDRELALAVGAALEGRLTADGRDAVALVPAGDGLGLTRPADGGQGPGRGSYRAAPQVVALYEEGLLEQLEALGVTAYVGIGPEHEPSVARWGDGGAMLLPVGTARELVDAVADHSPWAAHAAGMTPLADLDGSPTGPATPGLSRTLAVAGIAGPLLLAGLPGVASAATTPASHHPAGTRAEVTAVDTSLFRAKAAPPVPASTRAFLNQIERSLRFYLQQLRQTSTTNTAGMQALENQIMRLINAAANAQPRTTTPAPQQGGGSAGGGGQAPSNAGSQNGSGGQGQQSAGGQGQQGQGQQGQDQQGQGQQGQDQQGQAPQNQDVNQGQQDQNQQNAQDQNQQDPNGSQGSSTAQGPSASQGSMSGQGNSGQGNSGQGTSGQGLSGQGTSGSGLGTTASGSGGYSGLGSSSAGGGSYSGGGSSGGNSGGGSSGGNSGGGSSGGGSA